MNQVTPDIRPRPSADQPGTLRQQLQAVANYLTIDEDERLRDPDGCWKSARWLTIPHARRVVGEGIRNGW